MLLLTSPMAFAGLEPMIPRSLSKCSIYKPLPTTAAIQLLLYNMFKITNYGFIIIKVEGLIFSRLLFKAKTHI